MLNNGNSLGAIGLNEGKMGHLPLKMRHDIHDSLRSWSLTFEELPSAKENQKAARRAAYHSMHSSNNTGRSPAVSREILAATFRILAD